jgi:hypothetical protein
MSGMTGIRAHQPWQPVLRGPALASIEASIQRLEPHLAAVGLVRTNLPAVVPQTLVDAAAPHLDEQVQPTRLTTRHSQRRRGWLAMSGLCLQALPLFAAEPIRWSQLPLGFYTVGPSAHGVEGWSAEGPADVVAVNGLVASADPSFQGPIREVIDRCAAGLDHRATDGSPLLRAATGWLLNGPDGVLAHVVALPPALVAASKIACVAPGGEMRRPAMTAVYLSQSLLAASGP